MNEQLKPYIPLCEAIGKLFYPNVEVVMHDVISKKLVYIVNAFSKRRVGDMMAGNLQDIANLKQDWIGPYDKINDDGHRLKAVSIILKDVAKNPIGMICINYNTEAVENLFESLKGFLHVNEGPVEKPSAAFSQNWKEHTDQTIEKFLKEKNISLSGLSTSDKKELVIFLEEEGIFNIRNVVGYLCNVLQISRATIYNWLKKG